VRKRGHNRRGTATIRQRKIPTMMILALIASFLFVDYFLYIIILCDDPPVILNLFHAEAKRQHATWKFQATSY
jgi:hypothetical protein